MKSNMNEGGDKFERQRLLLQSTKKYASQLLEIPSDENGGLWGRRVSKFFSRVFPEYGRYVSVQEGWDYFENVTLPRRMSDGHDGYVKAPPGIKHVPTSLYPAWTTPQRALNDFGTGIAGYFGALKALIFIFLVAGFIYTPTFSYYASASYARDGQDSLTGTLRGSLICTQTKWVPCPNCTTEEWSDSLDRIAVSSFGLPFVLKNDCAPLRWQEGANHIVVLLFLIVSMIGLSLYQSRKEREYDEDVLTASDYSIKIDNPPPDATDPQEWKDFFSAFEGCEVVYCTVALNNEKLVNALVKRRVLMQCVEKKIKEGNDDDARSAKQKDAFEATSRLTKRKIRKNEKKCRELLMRPYPTSAVFVVFETELAQRTVLKTLSVGKVNVAANNTSVLPSKYLFRGSLVLDVTEAVEPSAIRWQDLDDTLLVKTMQRILTGLLTVAIIFAGFFFVKFAFEQSVNVAAFGIVMLNILVPLIFKQMNRLEAHAHEGGYQASLYIKLSTFRWINTAIITALVKPFASTISGGANSLIPAVHAILKAEIVTAPIVHMLDIVGQIKRHFLAPRANNQNTVMMMFRGSRQNLGDKYTNMTKIVFLCFFYAVVFPASFFYGAVALAVTYYTDKFLLMRSWGPLPELGDDVAKLSRRVFFPLAILALAVMSEVYWSAYPFDNVCELDETFGSTYHPEYIGVHSLLPLSSNKSHQHVTIQASVNIHDQAWTYCDQDFLDRASDLVRFFKRDQNDWMSNDQELLTFLFGISVVVASASIIVFLCVRSWIPSLREAISGDYFTDEIDSGKRFSSLERISAYVPQVRHPKFDYPLLACDIREIDSRHIGWSDPVRDFSYYNMALDLQILQRGDNKDEPIPKWPTLSTVQHWPTARKKVLDSDDKRNGKMYGAVDNI